MDYLSIYLYAYICIIKLKYYMHPMPIIRKNYKGRGYSHENQYGSSLKRMESITQLQHRYIEKGAMVCIRSKRVGLEKNGKSLGWNGHHFTYNLLIRNRSFPLESLHYMMNKCEDSHSSILFSRAQAWSSSKWDICVWSLHTISFFEPHRIKAF